MTLNKLGLFVKQSDARNNNEALNGETVVGLSTQKEIIKTKANLEGVSLTSYKLFPPMSFAYVPDTSRRGDKIALAFNDTKETYLISAIYIVFEVIESKRLDPWYLFMYFNRSEFDRYTRFHSWGSARETFNWEEMCDIEINLPPLPVQQKYVDIYKALVANLQSYERGLEDLKLSIDAFLDKIKHSSPARPVGEFMKEIDLRNDNGDITDVQGINIMKQFMPSIANTNGVNLSNYKVVNKGQFAYSGMQTGRDKCIRIALYNGQEPIIISPAYSVLEVKDETVLAEYIMMWFSRAESDRRGWFMSDSSIRTSLDLDRFYEINLPVPNMKIQKSIVELYYAYVIRKGICENLKSQLKDICPILIKGSLEEGIC
ncbi:MAG: restriction endonuclease subunit S [Saccharofermentanales bacterium]|jgi:type I restriction enzyme S subunit